MTTVIKIILYVVVFIIGGGIILAIQAATGRRTIGPIGLFIVIPCMLAAWRAIRKYEPKDKQNNEDIHTLTKN
jgi:hypothetical protein